jgi:putative DNA primase/helicase
VFILHGTGANGKSTFLETLSSLLGDYAMRTPTDTLLIKRTGAIPNDVARLKGARFVTAVEADEGHRMAESLVKQMTGGEKITARFLHREWFEFSPEFKIFLATNHKPVIAGTDHAIWRRIQLIPFNVTIPVEQQDKDLALKLRQEASGILAWAIQGTLEWQQGGLRPPEDVMSATKKYRDEMDSIAEFLDDICVEQINATVPVSNLYAAYSTWCETNGERTVAKRELGVKLLERGFGSRRGTGGQRFWIGLGLRAEPSQQELFGNDF